jgi:LuxR family maltose regulon positive regulatory protein
VQIAEPILATKLARPPPRADYVARPPLVELLRSATQRRLTLVSAPPGFGKTTLLAEWADTEPRPVAWLWLDASDNDPARFFAYAIAALQTVSPHLGAQALAALRAPGAGFTDVVLPFLINDLAALQDEIVLVFDDYHAITNAAVHNALGFLVERLPASLRLVIATREDPPLSLPRMRARGELGELRAQHLRFTAEETRTFLNETLAVGLSDADLERLQERTEGWPAALYLAALSMRERDDRSAFLAAFAGDDRHVVDYLTAEVLAEQPDQIRSFLLETSLLDRFCPDLCDAVRERTDSAGILQDLERVNLLLIPLDARREWYRYHQLFADLLRAELRRGDPDALAALHRRAGSWYRDAGQVIDAARHTSAAGDVAAAVELVAQYWHVFFEQGQLVTVADWLKALPQATIAADPTLALAAANVMTHLHRFDEAEEWLAAAELAGGAAAGPIESQRAALRLFRGDVGRATAAARSALAAAPEGAAGWSVVSRIVLGASLWWSGGMQEARSVFDQAAAIAAVTESPLGLVCARGFRAAIELEDGDAADAERVAREAVDLTTDAGLDGYPFTAIARVVLGKIAARAGEVATAREQLEAALRLAEREDSWPVRVYGLLALAEVVHRAGDTAAARRLVTRARETIKDLPDPGIGPALVERTERLLKLTPRRSPPAREEGYWELSERELEVLRLLATPRSQREIADQLYVSFNTARTHTRSIFRKLGVNSRADAVRRGRELGFL